MLVKKHTGKGGGREAGPADASPAGQRCAAAGPQCAALAALLSVVAILSCLYLGVKTNDLQARIAALESAKGAPSIPLLSDTEDQLKAMVQEKVERLLAQNSYEHMAKIRIAREAPSECNCPAGKMELISQGCLQSKAFENKGLESAKSTCNNSKERLQTQLALIKSACLRPRMAKRTSNVILRSMLKSVVG